MVTINDENETQAALAQVPASEKTIPDAFARKFSVLNAGEHAGWVFDNVDIDISPARSFMVPLLVRQRPIGAVVFEHRSPSDPSDQTESFSAAASIAAGIIAMTSESRQNTRLAENFADILGRLKTTRQKLAEAKTLEGVAEMAAGASHELNNPLAVISGRTQLLLDIETDENKLQMLKQISTRAEQVSQIVRDLMSFARPKAPAPVRINIAEIIDSAVRQTEQQYNTSQLDLKLESSGDLPVVTVDVNQVAEALKNILSNALDSYPNSNGPITISVDMPEEAGCVTIRISDSGCGMDTETLAKSAEPFFSAKPAGRKRGMGLAHARRLLNLNNAEIHIQSKPNHGTTVTIKIKN